MKNLPTIVVIVVGLCSGAKAQPTQLSLRQMYDSHNWFDLRDAIAGQTVRVNSTFALAEEARG